MSVTHDDDFNFESECPVCGAREYKHNAKSIAAIKKGRAMMDEIYSKLYKSLDEMSVDLDSDD